MYAIVDIAGQQFKVEQGWKVFVNRLQAEEGAAVSFDKVLLKDIDGKVAVGKPYLDGASVNATVLKHLKGEKVLVFKKRKKKRIPEMQRTPSATDANKIDTIS
jgi:large subunit ribosomal protein L21